MKKQITLLLILLSLAITSPTQAQPGYINPIDLGYERRIDLSGYIKGHDEVNDEQTDFRKYFKHSNPPSPPSSDPIAFVVGRMIEKMYFPVRKAINQNTGDCKNRRCVAALRIHHGLVGNKLTFVFEPIYLKLKGITVTPIQDLLEYGSFTSLGKFYIINPQGDFDEVKSNIANDLTTNYKGTMKKHPNYEPGGPTTTPVDLDINDVNLVIFSFQEILKFYHLEYDVDQNGEYYTSKMELHHGCIFVPVGSSQAPRHTMFFTREGWTFLTAQEKKTNTYRILTATSDDGANLGHLCPPRCNDLIYPSAN